MRVSVCSKCTETLNGYPSFIDLNNIRFGSAVSRFTIFHFYWVLVCTFFVVILLLLRSAFVHFVGLVFFYFASFRHILQYPFVCQWKPTLAAAMPTKIWHWLDTHLYIFSFSFSTLLWIHLTLANSHFISFSLDFTIRKRIQCLFGFHLQLKWMALKNSYDFTEQYQGKLFEPNKSHIISKLDG